MWPASSNPVPALACALAGSALVAVTLADVFYTVLFPGSGRGPVRKPLSRAVQWVFRRARHLRPARRRQVLAYAGPTEVTVTLVAWFVLLLTGWAAIYLPALGGAITAAQGSTDRTWWTALYFSGYNLTTLGLGDLVATSPGYRLLVVGEAATGFMSFTMAISYFISVYGTLTGRKSFALALHERSGGTGRGSVIVTALWEEGPVAAAIDLAAMAAGLREMVQTHTAYPVLSSFHSRRESDDLPRVLLTCCETVTILRTSVDARRHDRPELTGSVLDEIEASATALTGHRSSPTAGPVLSGRREAWRTHHRAVLTELAGAGVPVLAGSTEEYLRARSVWDAPLERLADRLLYGWPEELGPEPDPRGHTTGAGGS